MSMEKSLEEKFRPSYEYNYNILEEPSPLGLRLRKSPSFLNLIDARLSQNSSSTLIGADEQDDDLRTGRFESQSVRKENEITTNYIRSLETESSSSIDIPEDNSNGDHEIPNRRNNWRRKVSLDWIFVITNFILELPSAVFDQLSSVHKPQYALVGMVISFAAILICIVELIFKVRKEKVTWRWRGMLPWFYYPSQTQIPFCSFKDIIGLVCAICQSIVTTVNYAFSLRHADNPIKISVWPIIFAFGLLCAKLLEKPEKRPLHNHDSEL